MTLLTAAALAEIRARADAATEGPWIRSGVRQKVLADCLMVGPDGFLIVAVPCEKDHAGAFKDANFVAHARTDMPALLAHADAMAERAADLSRQCDVANGVIMKYEARITRLRAVALEVKYGRTGAMVAALAALLPGDLEDK